MIIEVDNLVKEYKTHKREEGLLSAFKSLFKRKYYYKRALEGVSFKIKKGEIVGFIGPNGAGKSTTIKALSGILYPTSGTIKVMDYLPWKDRVKYVKNIGVVFGQKAQLIWDIPAIDSFYLNKEIYEIPNEIFYKNLDYMTELLDIKEIVKVPVRDLSLGERMKCTLVNALLHNPPLVFLDEPSIGLDVVAKDKMRSFIKKINKEQETTFIITTHDMQDIEKLCERIIIINDGVIVYDGPLRTIKKDYLKKKIIDVKSGVKIKKFVMEGCNVLDDKEFEMKIEVDTSKQKIKNVIDILIKEYDILDMEISDPPIEEIIQMIYKKKK